MKGNLWKKFAFEFLSIFVAVITAFALGNWNDNRKERFTEVKILEEIANGLEKDIEDIKQNIFGHDQGIQACKYWRNAILNTPVDLDSTAGYYLALTRDFICIQNVSGYESLKSKGLEAIKLDSLRFKIISLYEYDFHVLKQLEESYYELQFQKNYFHAFNDIIAPHLLFDQKGKITGFKQPLKLSETEKSRMLSYLWKIETNRKFALFFYNGVEKKIEHLIHEIELEANR